MKILGHRANFSAILEKLNETPISSIDEHSQKVALKLLDVFDLNAKVTDLRAKIKELRVQECLVTIEEGYIVLKDTADFENNLEYWIKREKGNAKRVANSIRKSFYNEHVNLILSSNQIKSLSPKIGNLTNLKVLVLENNQLQYLPPEIKNLTNLQKLVLSENELQSLPLEIEELTNLQVLDLDHNQLQFLPCEIGNLASLQGLNLSCNQLQSLPREIGNLVSLRELYLNYNKLQRLPHEIGNLVSLRELYLNGNKLQRLPHEIGNLRYLENLNLQHNQLQSLPPEIGNLTNLRWIPLSYNKLQSLPREIGNLTNLQDLYLSRNKLQSLPPEIGNLTNLNVLVLENNQLQYLPPEIRNLTGLRELYLNGNKLQRLPHEIGNLRYLEDLNLQHNQLQSLPLEIKNLINLAFLDLENNFFLKSLPLSLRNCSNLTFLSIENTSIPESDSSAITRAASVLRHTQSINKLPEMLCLWEKFAQLDLGLSSIIDTLDTFQKKIIYRWLIQLEGAKDFETCQKDLAKVVCEMLFSLKDEGEYRTQFLHFLEDTIIALVPQQFVVRFNILYTCWKAEKELANKPLKQNLDLAFKISKTIALRKYLIEQINAHKLVESVSIEESSETLLYYETLLKEELGLETAISTMSYEKIDQREWISLEQLKTYVLNNAYSFLADMELIQQQALKDPEVQEEISRKQSEYKVEKQDGETENEFLNRSESAKNDMEAFVHQTIINWAKEILES